MSKDDFKYEPNMKPLEGGLNIVSAPGGSIIQGGSMESPNYAPGKSGWALKSDGTIEARKLKIGQTIVSVDAGGDVQEQMDWLNDNGGGVLYLREGTHILSADLTWYSNIELRGQSAENTTIDFNSGSYQIKVVGSSAYTTGTVALSNGDTTVVGSGTTWTSSMVGQSIMLGGLYYTISGFTDTTHVTIAASYAGADLSGESYVICTPIQGVKINNIKFTGSATNCLKIQYAREVFLEDVEFQASVGAIDIDDSENVSLQQIDYAVTVSNAIDISNGHFIEIKGSGGINAGGVGLNLNGCSTMGISTSFFMNSTGNNITMTDCTDVGFLQTNSINSSAKGIELVSGCDRNSIQNSSFRGNASDNVKLTATSDRNIITGCVIEDAGGYGINIAAATCDNNTINPNGYNNNTSGDVNDEGTGTIKSLASGGGLTIQSFTSTGADTWTKPDGAKRVLVQMWGGGGSGAVDSANTAGSDIATGGGGGAYVEKYFDNDDLGSTETVTVGAGGAAVASGAPLTGTDGNAGGNTTFGSLLTAYGGGAGKRHTATNTDVGGGGAGCFSGAGGDGTTTAAGAAGSPGEPWAGDGDGSFGLYGGGGGWKNSSEACIAGGNSLYGGAGGGAARGNPATASAGGTSKNGGNGGAANGSGDGTDGVQPAGGGGASLTGTSGKGGDGKVVVTTFY